MSIEKQFFESHIVSLQSLTSLYQYINNNASLVDADALLRAEYVLIVSAFDNYLHQIVRRRIRELFFGGAEVASNLAFPVPVFQMIHDEDDETVQKEIFDAELRKVLEKDSYQSPRGVEYALNLIHIKKIWTDVIPFMEDSAINVKRRLSLIVKRRNQIAHEADVEYNTGFPRDIDEQTVLECREFLSKLVSSIDALIT
ncbi:HEPN domain-containing protein [Sporolactobacillus shoreicorticis]|uniref:HEPN domain-containing protein n=1 Tax=Sporolactobacillus shoreicorticis TaxID=1923877 RepID=A0ABW5SAE9_9BACL|nr:HEPN domain-containing protein [Sporolactobacillus shoreicorticis]MCO7126179.1 HEPN domain-containing protein [Sporolactobacillus shoreicorticis]